MQNKKKILVGLMFMGLSFICVLGLFYCMVSDQKVQYQEIKELEDKMVFLTDEKDVSMRKTADLETKLGNTLHLEKFISKAREEYGGSESVRKEGYLWVDRSSRTLVATLGILNGVKPDSFLTVYDGEKKVGTVQVKTPFDVISYVRLMDQSIDQFSSDYYRVVSEE